MSALYVLASGSAGRAKLEIEAALNVTENENYVEDYSFLLSSLQNSPIQEEDENSQYTLEICNGAFYQTKFQNGDVAVFSEVEKIKKILDKNDKFLVLAYFAILVINETDFHFCLRNILKPVKK